MSELGIFSTFKNSELGCSLTTLKVNDDIWLIGTEFATALEYANPQKAIRDHVDESDKFYFQDLDTGDLSRGSNPRGVNESFTPCKIQPHTLMITESGAYCLILRSNLPAAKKFQKWLTKEVIPTLRKTGMYTIPEGVLPKLREIEDEKVCKLRGEEKKEFRKESKHKSGLAKDQHYVKLGKIGGANAKANRYKLKEEFEKLKVENTNLKREVNLLEKDVDTLTDQNAELENQVDELTQELDAIKSGIAEILADDY